MTKIGPLKPYVADNSSRGVIHSLEINGNPYQKSVISYAFGNTFEKREISYANIQVIFPSTAATVPRYGGACTNKTWQRKNNTPVRKNNNLTTS